MTTTFARVPAPALLVQAEVTVDHDDAEQPLVLHHPAGVVEAVARRPSFSIIEKTVAGVVLGAAK